MTEELQTARDRVLVENTAQAVFKHLDRIEDNRAVLGPRWIWELFQNARDAAHPQGVSICLHLSDSELRFEHDGKPFASGEIAHLVYHGSTKIEDPTNMGQFGSGFLSTHLLSRVVRVSGRLDDMTGFNFSLDRTGDTVEYLRDAMDQSWEDFKRSVEDRVSTPNATTTFKYEITEQSRQLSEQGLEHLRQCGPLVLAFCPEINSITVETSNASWQFQRNGEDSLHDGDVLTIEYREDDRARPRFVAVVGAAGECCAAFQLCLSDSGLQVDPAQVTAANLFALFPLIGSERLGLPASINSKHFKAREDRDGIVLSSDSSGGQNNQKLLEDAVRLQVRLLELCAEKKWRGIECLLAFDNTNLPDWVERDGWFCKLLTDLVRSARTTPLMPTLGGDWIEPRTAWLPATGNACHNDKIWTLMSSWRDAPTKLPCRDHQVSWSRNLANWASLLNCSSSEMEEALTLAKVAELVSDAGSVKALQQRLDSGDGLSWLVALLQLILDAGDTSLFDEHDLLPSQGGCLRRRSTLHRDKSISDELKDIAEAFDLDIRNKLLNTRAEEEIDGIADLLVSEQEPDVLHRLLERVNEQCRDGVIDASLVSWVVKLFWWMVRRPDYVDHLDGYPVPTTQESDHGITVLHLEQGCEALGRPLAPLAIWPEGAREFGSLFPRRRILSDAFASGDPDLWQQLVSGGYLNTSPLITTKRTVDAFLPDEPLPEGDGTESHKSKQEFPVSDVVCLKDGDIGLIDMARRSRTRAVELIRFLVEFVIEEDEQAFAEFSVDCECGEEHKVYGAAWLTPLHRRRWVPIDPARSRADRASAQSLARVLADSPEVADLLSGDQSDKFLSALGISRADLALRLVADNEEKRIVLIQSMQALWLAAGDVDRVRELATEIREHPEIIDFIEERKGRRKKIQRNQEIGRVVEDLLRQELEDHGLTVRRTGRGSDFEVETDYVENEEEDVWIEVVDDRRSTLIEVKGTTVDHVRMTPLQVQTACTLNDSFALCVVSLDDESPTREMIHEHLRVVFGIGMHLESALDRYRSLREVAEVARRPQGAIELEVMEGEVRFRIGCSIWSDALSFEQAVERFKGGSV